MKSLSCGHRFTTLVNYFCGFYTKDTVYSCCECSRGQHPHLHVRPHLDVQVRTYDNAAYIVKYEVGPFLKFCLDKFEVVT
jgi:hypothetical protein